MEINYIAAIVGNCQVKSWKVLEIMIITLWMGLDKSLNLPGIKLDKFYH